MKSYLITTLTLAIVFRSVHAEEITFDLKAKTRERDGVHEFFVPDPDKFSTLILPDEPRKHCASVSEEGAAAMKDLEGLAMGRYHIKGLCVPREEGKTGHRITQVTYMMPLGEGVVQEEGIVITGRLEVTGDPNAADYLTTSQFYVHRADGISFRIPAKKFKEKPSGLTYQDAAQFGGQTIRMKVRAQYYREAPHRIATVYEFTKPPYHRPPTTDYRSPTTDH